VSDNNSVSQKARIARPLESEKFIAWHWKQEFKIYGATVP